MVKKLHINSFQPTCFSLVLISSIVFSSLDTVGGGKINELEKMVVKKFYDSRTL